MFPYSSHVLGRPGRSATAAQLRAEEASVAEVAAVLGRPRALLVRALARTLRGHEGDDRRGSGGHPRTKPSWRRGERPPACGSVSDGGAARCWRQACERRGRLRG
jgi:hypothetical protein